MRQKAEQGCQHRGRTGVQSPDQPVMEAPWAALAGKPWIPADEAQGAAPRLRVRDEHPPREGPEQGRRVSPRPRWKPGSKKRAPREAG